MPAESVGSVQECSDESRAERVRAAFREQAGWCSRLGSPFTALVCATLAEQLDASTEIGRRVLAWQGDPMADALSLRVCGALHSLARSGADPGVAALYPIGTRSGATPDETECSPGSANPDVLALVVRQALERHPAHFAAYLATAPQTNEVGRSAVLICGFLEIARRCGLPLQLFELGSSAGLNLSADRYRYRFGAAQWGDPGAALLLEPEWQGPPPPVGANLRVIERRGCDIAPLDVSVAAERARLISYIWADQTDRLSRLEAAMETALLEPPRLERMEAAEWVEQRIPELPDTRGYVRVLFHSVVWNYLSSDTQRRIQQHMERCGAQAQPDAPLAWLKMELIDEPPGTALTLRMWPAASLEGQRPASGEERVLAYAQPHGKSIVYAGSP